MTSVTAASPPDDSGSDAFRRFSYQAHVVFPLCLRLYFVGDVVAIYCEHWEDVLVEFTDDLRFTQIKTRDAGRGPWKYRHLLDEGGALRSLLRTHRALAALGEARPVEYDICLEGAADSADEIMRLVVGGDGASDEMCRACAGRLEMPEAEARSLLDRVTVTPNQPPRTMIAASNRDLLRLRAGHLPANELNAVYDATVALIKRAMEADLLADAWPEAILTPRTGAEDAERGAAAKRLDRERLQPILSRLEGGDQRLLAEISDPAHLRATALERKLTAAGGSAALVERAKQFRAQAAIRMAELRGGSLYDVDAMVADLHLRLLTAAEAVADVVSAAAPAAEVWNQLEQRLGANAAAYDPRRLLGQDHLLLLGEVCQLSDECKYRWGVRA